MVDKVITEAVLVDGLSGPAKGVEKALDGIAGASLRVISAEEKRERAAARAIANFEKLERQQDGLARASQRLASDLRKIDFAKNTGGLGQTEQGLQRVARATQLANERFDRQRRELEGNITAYERLRNTLDPISRSQREFAAGQEVISAALASGEVSIERNAAELERLQAALDDQRRSATFAADDYAQLQQRLDPLTAAQREFNIAASTVGDALARGRISVQQAAEDFAKLRRELGAAQDAVSAQRTAFDQLEASLNPLAAANQRFEDGIRQVNAAVASGEASDERAAAVKQRLTNELREAERAATENVSAFQRLRNEIDPLARAEQELAQRIRIVEEAVESGQASEIEAAQIKGALRQRVEDLRASIEQQGTAYRRLVDSIDPVSAAQRQLDRDLQTVQEALRAGEIELEEYDATVARLDRRFDDFRRQADQAVTGFQKIRNSVDPASRALDEFTRDSNEVALALERQETSAAEAARVMRLLEQRYQSAARGADLADGNFGNLGRSVGRLNLAFSAGSGVIAAFAGSFVIRELVRFNDVMQQAENRLRIVTDSAAQLTSVQEDLFAGSNRTFQAFLTGVEIYERLARSTRELGVSSDRLISVTESVQQAVALSGTTALAASAALIQFGQGLAANSLRGQELNSVMEQTPRLARALAQGLGVGIGDLRELANQGLLDSEKVIGAIEKSAAQLRREFDTITPTIAQSLEVLNNSLAKASSTATGPLFDEIRNQVLDFAEFLNSPETLDAIASFGKSLADLPRLIGDAGTFAAAAGASFAVLKGLQFAASIASVQGLTRAALALNAALLANPYVAAAVAIAAGITLVSRSLDENRQKMEALDRAARDSAQRNAAAAGSALVEETELTRKELDRRAELYDRFFKEIRERQKEEAASAPPPLTPAIPFGGIGALPQFGQSVREAREEAARLAQQAVEAEAAFRSQNLTLTQTAELLGLGVDRADALRKELESVDPGIVIDIDPLERLGRALDEAIAKLEESGDLTFRGVAFEEQDVDQLKDIRDAIGELQEASAAGAGTVDGEFNPALDALRDKIAGLVPDADITKDALVDLFKGSQRALEEFNEKLDEARFNSAFRALLDRAEKAKLPEPTTGEKLVSDFQKRFPERFLDPEVAAAVKRAAQDIDDAAESAGKLSKESKDAAKSFLDAALAAREIRDLEIQLEAARGGPEVLKAAQEEIDLQKELLKLEADARKEGRNFRRAEEEARLRQIQGLEREIDIALEAYDEFQRRIDRIRDDVANSVGRDVDDITDGASRDRRFAGVARQRDFALQQALEALDRRLAEFEEVDSIAFSTQEQLDAQMDVFRAAREEIIEAYEEGGKVFEQSVRDAAKELTATLLEDLLFNAGRGLGEILKTEIQRSVGDVIIDPLSDFLSGSSDDLFGDILGGLERVVDRFSKIGSQLDKVFGTGGQFSSLLGAAGAGFAGFGLGTGAADLLNGEQGETGSKIGGVVGGAAGFAVGGPIGAFIGSAAGSFLGDIFGGLFGRKTASGTLDLLSGQTNLTDSKKDVRNEERNTILDQAAQAIEALAEALGANIRAGTGIQVNVGKGQTQTDIVDPATGRVIRRAGTSARGDVDDAISDILGAALDAVLTGGDDRLTRIAKAFSDASVPAEQLLESLSSLSSVFDFIEEPASEFSQILDEVVDVFEDASAVAGQYAAAQRELAQAQLDTLEALAGRFDEDTEEATRRLTDPLLQDALDLAEEQVRRLGDAQRLNDEILSAIAALNASTSTQAQAGAFGGAGGFGFGRSLEDILGREARELVEQSATGSGVSNSVDAIAAQAEAQERLRKIIELNTQELIAFVRSAGDTPDAFRAVTAAIAELRTGAQDLGVDFEDLEAALESLRSGFASEFDSGERRRRLEIESPLTLQAEELIDAQIAIIASANAIGGTQQELSARLQRTFEINALEIERFIEGAASTPDAIAEIVAALETLRDRADEIGLTVSQIDQLSAGAISGAGDGFLESINKSFLELTNEPLSRFTALLENQERLVETAQRFAQLQPGRFGGLPTIVQNLNALERERFLEGLSEEDKLELGAFVGLIEDYGGRIAVVTTELRDTLNTTVTEVEEEIGRLSDVVEDATSRANALLDARQGIEDRFFPGSPEEQFRSVERRLEDAFRRAQAGDESAFEDLPDLASQFVDRASSVFGANTDFVEARDRALEILTQAEELERARATEAQNQIDIMEADLEVSRNILKSLESAQDNTLFLQHILDNGLLQNELLNRQIEELVRLRALQSGVDLNRVEQLAGVDSADAILSGFRAASASQTPPKDEIEALLRAATTSALPNFSFAQSGADVALQFAEILAIARAAQPELGQQPQALSTSAPQVQNLTTAPTAGQTEVVLAIVGLEETVATAFSRLVAAIDSLSDEIRILRGDNQRLNNELKAAFRLAFIENTDPR